jgi:hypothetical protein
MIFNRFDGYSIFDDKGEVKRLVESLIQKNDPEVRIESMRKFDFSYVFTLSKRGRTEEVELTRQEIDASWDWRRENIDETLKKKVETTILNL